MKNVRFSSFLLFMSMCTCAAAQSTQGAQPGQLAADARSDSKLREYTSRPFQQRYPRYQVRRSDVINVEFAFSPQFDQTVTVQPDGFITLKPVGDIQVANLTLPQLTETIRNAYRNILHDPVITVSLKDFDKPFFIASGEVGHPGKFELRGDTTLVEALAIAGGLTESAKHSQVVLFRRISDDTVEAKTYNVKQMLARRDLEEDPRLLPGDMLFVPQNKISKLRRYIPTSSMGMYLTPNPF